MHSVNIARDIEFHAHIIASANYLSHTLQLQYIIGGVYISGDSYEIRAGEGGQERGGRDGQAEVCVSVCVCSYVPANRA